ncbi:unnamed protein product [Coccothraustes coccothraustes]
MRHVPTVQTGRRTCLRLSQVLLLPPDLTLSPPLKPPPSLLLSHAAIRVGPEAVRAAVPSVRRRSGEGGAEPALAAAGGSERRREEERCCRGRSAGEKAALRNLAPARRRCSSRARRRDRYAGAQDGFPGRENGNAEAVGPEQRREGEETCCCGAVSIPESCVRAWRSGGRSSLVPRLLRAPLGFSAPLAGTCPRDFCD